MGRPAFFVKPIRLTPSHAPECSGTTAFPFAFGSLDHLCYSVTLYMLA